MLDAAGGGTKVPRGQEFSLPNTHTHPHSLSHSLSEFCGPIVIVDSWGLPTMLVLFLLLLQSRHTRDPQEGVV